MPALLRLALRKVWAPQRRGRGAGEFQAQQLGHCCFWGLSSVTLILGCSAFLSECLRLNLDWGLFLHCRVSGTQPALPPFLIVNSFFFLELGVFLQGFFQNYSLLIVCT